MRSFQSIIGAFYFTFLGQGILLANSPPVGQKWREALTLEAQQLNVQGIEQFENGIFGQYKQSQVFFTTIDQIPDDRKFYWVIVKVLSEKYACFMTKRLVRGNLYRFYCKDKRSIVFRHGKVNKTRHFYSRAYNRDGQLIPLKP